MALCIIDDIRDEGFTDITLFPDARVQKKIDEATAIIELITRRFFEPRDLVIKVDGRASPDLLLEHPIISITEVRILAQDIASQDVILETDEFEVYNRHLTQGLLEPDDRDNPHLSLIRFTDSASGNIRTTFRAGVVFGTEFWPFGVQNIQVDGRFGYRDRHPTDPGANPDGIVPVLIARACMLIAASKMEGLATTFNTPTGSIIMERVKDQAMGYSRNQQQGSFRGGLTGNSSGSLEADQILSAFMKPMDMGAA